MTSASLQIRPRPGSVAEGDAEGRAPLSPLATAEAAVGAARDVGTVSLEQTFVSRTTCVAVIGRNSRRGSLPPMIAVPAPHDDSGGQQLPANIIPADVKLLSDFP